VNGDRVRALRYAREVVDDLHWRGMAVPPVYAGMADEFRALVRSGGYAAWVAGLDEAADAPPQDSAAVATTALPPAMPPVMRLSSMPSPRAFVPR